MQLQPATLKTFANPAPHPFGLCLGTAVHEDIVGIPLERYVAEVLEHPAVEGKMQKHIRDHGTDYTALRRTSTARLDAFIGSLNAGFQPAPDIEEHPAIFREALHRSHRKRVVQAVKEGANVEVKDPRVAPAPLPGLFDCLMGGAPRAIAVRVRMELTFRDGPQMHRDDRLRDPISHGGNAEFAHTAVTLRDLHLKNRRREIRPRGESVPDAIEIPCEIFLERLDALAIYPRSALVGLYGLVGLPHHLLRDGERLRRRHRFIPQAVGPSPRLDNAIPSLHPLSWASSLLRIAPPLCSASVLARSWRPSTCALPLSSERQVLTFRIRACSELTPPLCRVPPSLKSGIRWALSRANLPSRFRHCWESLRHVISGSLAFVFSDPTCRDDIATFASTFTTSALYRRSLRWFGA